MPRNLFYLILFSGIFIIFFLSWSSQPDLTKQILVPGWLGRWANHYDKLRTGIPFFFLGLFVSIWLSRQEYKLQRWLTVWLELSLVAIIAETGQLLLPTRVFDWIDIIWGIVGAFIGMAPFAILSLFVQQKKSLQINSKNSL